ncbi:hypothetical protein [Aquisalibacillus elongatus]|uniref:Uncharacterized protein n=1 Tax=Aquisalibacillus elongatus TaxID=485577 RepID=A0A3N5C3D4_9BACI|nr:hypothetical protein [Aquisalibacillus elongatus]RPF53942.1 hypothetical protein EDC24_1127 [Aquisalibacillus elongatus]
MSEETNKSLDNLRYVTATVVIILLLSGIYFVSDENYTNDSIAVLCAFAISFTVSIYRLMKSMKFNETTSLTEFVMEGLLALICFRGYCLGYLPILRNCLINNACITRGKGEIDV